MAPSCGCSSPNSVAPAELRRRGIHALVDRLRFVGHPWEVCPCCKLALQLRGTDLPCTFAHVLPRSHEGVPPPIDCFPSYLKE